VCVLCSKVCAAESNIWGRSAPAVPGKLAINLPLMIYWQAFGRGACVGAAARHRSDATGDLFADTSGGPNVLKTRGKAIAEELASEYKGPVTFDVRSMRKDLVAMIAEAIRWASRCRYRHAL